MFGPDDDEAPPGAWAGGRRRRGVATGIDQAVSSVTNFALAVAIARSGSARDFGAYTVAITSFSLAIALVRSISADPLMVRYSATRADDQSEAAGGAISAVVVLGACFAGLMLFAAATQGAEARAALGAMGLILVGVLLQDALRFVWFSAGSPQAALLNDAAWLATSLVAYLALGMAGRASMPSLILAWGLTGTACFGVGIVSTGLSLRLPAGVAWLRSQRSLGLRFAGEVAIDGVLFELALVLIGWIAGLPALGLVFAARLMLAPVNVLFMGITAFAIPEGVRLRTEGVSRLHHLIRTSALVSMLAVVVWTFVCLALPSQVGEAFLGNSWSGARELLLPTALGVAAFGVTQSARSGLRALADARRSLRARACGAPGFVVFGTVGAATGGARGAAWGLAASFAGLGVLMWSAYRRSLSEAAAEGDSPGRTPR